MTGVFNEKFLIILLMIFNISLVTSCSTYNSMVPSWMEIGSTDKTEDSKDTTEDNESEATWWNHSVGSKYETIIKVTFI